VGVVENVGVAVGISLISLPVPEIHSATDMPPGSMQRGRTLIRSEFLMASTMHCINKCLPWPSGEDDCSWYIRSTSCHRFKSLFRLASISAMFKV
jgi:hypothetical protein